jgi:hypothetical protein
MMQKEAQMDIAAAAPPATSPLVGEIDALARSAEAAGEGGGADFRGWRCHPHPLLRSNEGSTSPIEGEVGVGAIHVRIAGSAS